MGKYTAAKCGHATPRRDKHPHCAKCRKTMLKYSDCYFKGKRCKICISWELSDFEMGSLAASSLAPSNITNIGVSSTEFENTLSISNNSSVQYVEDTPQVQHTPLSNVTVISEDPVSSILPQILPEESIQNVDTYLSNLSIPTMDVRTTSTGEQVGDTFQRLPPLQTQHPAVLPVSSQTELPARAGSTLFPSGISSITSHHVPQLNVQSNIAFSGHARNFQQVFSHKDVGGSQAPIYSYSATPNPSVLNNQEQFSSLNSQLKPTTATVPIFDNTQHTVPITQMGIQNTHGQYLQVPMGYFFNPYGNVTNVHPNQIAVNQLQELPRQTPSSTPVQSITTEMEMDQPSDSESDFSDRDAPPKQGEALERTYAAEENVFRKGVKIVFDTLKDSLTPPPAQADELDKRYESDDGFGIPDKSKTQFLFLPMADRIRWDLDRACRQYQKATEKKLLSRSYKSKSKGTPTPVGVFPSYTELSVPKGLSYKKYNMAREPWLSSDRGQYPPLISTPEQTVLQWEERSKDVNLPELAFKRLDKISRSSIGMASTLNYFVKAQLVNLAKVKNLLDASILDPTLPPNLFENLSSMRDHLENGITLGEQVRRIGYDSSEAVAQSYATLTLAVRDKWLSQLPEQKVSRQMLDRLRFAPFSGELFEPSLLSACTEEMKTRRGEILHEQWEAAATIDVLKRNSKRHSTTEYLPNKKSKTSYSGGKSSSQASASQLERVQAQLVTAKAELAKFKTLTPSHTVTHRDSHQNSRQSNNSQTRNKGYSNRGRGRGKPRDSQRR